MADAVGQFLDIIDNRIEKHLDDNTYGYVRQRGAVVTEYDNDSKKAFVYFVDDESRTQYTFYNKTNELLSSGDNVKVYYVTNPAKGWIGARCGEPVIKEINTYGGEGVGRPSPWDITSEYFNCYDIDATTKNPLNEAGTTGRIGYYSTARGYLTKATGAHSSAEGYKTISSGTESHAEGGECEASGMQSHAEGGNCVSSGNNSHSEGRSTKALSYCCHSEGSMTIASSHYAHAEGVNSVASGAASHAEGQNTTAGGEWSHAEGYGTKATKQYAHSEGEWSTASGECSHAEGYTSCSSGYCSHSEGNNTESSGNYSHAEGSYTIASGNYSHVGGYETQIASSYSFAHGYYLNIDNSSPSDYYGGKTAFGACNDCSDKDVIFMIGNGKSSSERSNAFTVDVNGNITCTSINGFVPTFNDVTFVAYTTDEAKESAKTIFSAIMG